MTVQEDAAHTGTGWSRNGPEGNPGNVGKFAGNYNVGGLRTGSDVQLSFDVEVPQDGRYHLSVSSNTYNKYPSVVAQGPTNVFLRVDGKDPRQLNLPVSYEWVVWDHTGTRVPLTADGVDPATDGRTGYEAEYADLAKATIRYDVRGSSGPGAVSLRPGPARSRNRRPHRGRPSGAATSRSRRARSSPRWATGRATR
ncbi:hypothetical protein AB0M80_35235 [Amycolatopsis sp. NPDC051045]|uniref:hypothetical protein n=1 Tax=Amycolatopsis sp. NPDC051045 TaxID=3156922 RepID=UPI003417EE27